MISKILNALLLPPGIFILLAVGSLCMTKLFNKKVNIIYMTIVSVFLYLLSSIPISNMMIHSLETEYAPICQSQIDSDILDTYDYIVVLGGGLYKDSPEYGSDILKNSAKQRHDYAWELYKISPKPIIVTGGTVVRKDGVSEAQIAKEHLMELGIPESDIIVESRSFNTYENAQYTYDLIGDHSIVLVTSAFHMDRGYTSFVDVGFTSILAGPTDYWEDKSDFNLTYALLPSIDALQRSYISLHEWLGKLYYNLFY